MKTVFDLAIRAELIRRIGLLNENSKAAWGKMTIYQMLKHCTQAEEMYLGQKQYKRVPLGFIFGRMALKGILKDENPMRKNAPTHHAFIIKGEGDVEAEKTKWIQLIETYGSYSNTCYVHWFFGKMTKEQVGFLAYKHIDHHLRQFGA